MPKYLAGKIVVRTFETWAESPEEAEAFILKWQEGETEKPEGGVKVISYKLGWSEFNTADPTKERDIVLAEFLNLMQHTIPGMPESTELATPKQGLIIHPFKKG